MGEIAEVERRSVVTRLGAGVETTGMLAADAIARVTATLDDYSLAIESHSCNAKAAVMTSAVRDARNGGELVELVRSRYDFGAKMISGDDEAQMSFLGAMTEREHDDPTPTLLIDVGGGSTELILGSALHVDYHVSLQLGVVRHGERHLHSDPPTPAEIRALTADAHAVIAREVPREVRTSAGRVIAVGGTATSCAAIEERLEHYDASLVHGYRVRLEALRGLLRRLIAMTDAERRGVTGLHPDRAPTIVPGVAILMCVLEAFGMGEFEASEHDILYGLALECAHEAETAAEAERVRKLRGPGLV